MSGDVALATPETQPSAAPPAPAWLKRLIPTFTDDFQVKILDAKGHIHWQSNAGPQTWALFSPYDEQAWGGRRGGGKTAALIAWMTMGDWSLPDDDPARLSFLNDSSYRGLLLRESYQDMAEFVEEAKAFYKVFGGKATDDPTHIDFKSGARIYFNHLQSEDAFNKYKGWNITRIGIEELTQIKTQRQYLRLQGSLRSTERVRGGKTFPPLRTLIVGTTNPDGPGAPWVKARFVSVLDNYGKRIPPNTPILDPISGLKSIFIPFPIDANPYYAENTTAGRSYRARLMAQDEVTRRQWVEGDWDVGSGQFFDSYRPDGPIGEEEKRLYPWARHLVAPVPLRPWWYRWGDGDWGWRHPSCYHKLVRNEADGRIHIYDELQVRNVGSFEQGAMLARWWQHDLIALKEAGRDPCVVIYMSGVHGDVFSKDDASKSKAEQILAGIREVLGPFGALLLKYDENEREVMLRDKQRAQAMFEKRRQELAGHICIALKPIYFDRVSAWDYLRDCLRFRPARLAFANQDERERYLREVLATEGRESYERIRTELERVKPEILPRLQIWDCCRELDRCFRVAQCDMSNEGDPSKTSRSEDVLKFNANSETGEGGDDALDAARLGVLAYKEIQTQIPLSYFVSDRIEEAKEACLRDTGETLDDPTRLAMISRQATANYGKLHAPAKAQLYLPRASSQRHRRNP